MYEMNLDARKQGMDSMVISRGKHAVVEGWLVAVRRGSGGSYNSSPAESGEWRLAEARLFIPFSFVCFSLQLVRCGRMAIMTLLIIFQGEGQGDGRGE